MIETPESFMEYFRQNYPGPNTIIHNPDWHAPKIYRAALACSGYSAMYAACKEIQKAYGCFCEYHTSQLSDYAMTEHSDICFKLQELLK